MNKHLTDGELRLALDGELDTASRQHLAGCEACRARQAAVLRRGKDERRRKARRVEQFLRHVGAEESDARAILRL